MHLHVLVKSWGLGALCERLALSGMLGDCLVHVIHVLRNWLIYIINLKLMNNLYFELEFQNGDTYKGHLVDSSLLKGLAIYMKKNKQILIGTIDSGAFSSYGVCLDIQEKTRYQGQLRDSKKHGLGVFHKIKSDSEFSQMINVVERCNKSSYERVINEQIEQAKQAADKSTTKIQKMQNLFMQAPLKDVLKEVKLSKEQCEQKNQKKKDTLNKYVVSYTGEFEEDKRHGWGVNMFRNGDTYKGQFSRDQLLGRGYYWWNSLEHNSVFYVGEFKDNAFHGLGKMEFRDGTQYYGSFNNNVMSSMKAILKYGNEDRFKGIVQQNQKNGNGVYTYANGDTYEGQFRGDRKEGTGKMLFSSTQVTYEGEFQDDKKTGKGKYNFGSAYGKFEGELDQNEQLKDYGVFDFPLQNMKYEGQFKENKFHGKGKITHTNTDNAFEGEFYQHHKDGPATFTLKSGEQFKGNFELNMESTKGSQYGQRT